MQSRVRATRHAADCVDELYTTATFAWRDTPGARHAREDTRPDSMHSMNRIYILSHYTSALFPLVPQSATAQFREGISTEIEISTIPQSHAWI